MANEVLPEHVRDVRDKTSAPLLDCKKALQESEGNIEKEIEQLQVNKIEFSFYNNSDYLNKLHNIYFSVDHNYPEKNIISLPQSFTSSSGAIVWSMDQREI